MFTSEKFFLLCRLLIDSSGRLPVFKIFQKLNSFLIFMIFARLVKKTTKVWYETIKFER